MEGLIFLAIMVWIFKAIAKSSKKPTAKRQERPAAQPKQYRRKPMQPAQPTVQEPFANAPEPVTGSMAYTSTEGMASEEGEDECDPSLGHGKGTAPESVYADEIGGETLPAITPQSLVQGVVMSEILQRPVSLRRR